MLHALRLALLGEQFAKLADSFDYMGTAYTIVGRFYKLQAKITRFKIIEVWYF